MRTGRAIAVAALLAACATDEPAALGSAASMRTSATVTLFGDDFALLDGERMPLDAVVLRLRWRVRAMSKEQLATFGVQIVVGAGVPETAARRVVADRGRLIDELDVMEVGYVKM
jgi:hypothetical protein